MAWLKIRRSFRGARNERSSAPTDTLDRRNRSPERRDSARRASQRGDRRQTLGRRRSDLPRPFWRDLPSMAVAAAFGVGCVLMISNAAHSQTPTSTSEVGQLVYPVPAIQAVAPNEKLDALENRLRVTTRAALAVDDALAGELLVAAENVFEDELGADERRRVETKLVALGLIES